ncbi:MAG TPA: TonB-dependent receptor [Prolixibacteraceae bacterium]|nr:TonB-dependent receptor [Prolixibacteraceae bacterium]
MKLVTLFLFVAVMHVSAASYSQNTKLTIIGKNLSIGEILDRIENQSNFSFFFNADQIDLKKRIDMDADNQILGEILDGILADSGLTYTVNNKLIVIHKTGETDNLLTSQQSRNVSGKVTDSNGGSFPGVSVFVKGTTNGTITNIDGVFSLTNIPATSTIVFSFIGMKTEEILVGNKSVVNLTMTEESFGLNEVVAIGYGTVKKSDVTGAVTSVSAKDLNAMPVTNVIQGMQGKAAGVDITSSDRPGQLGSVRIRGVRSITASNDPLYVVDGIPLSSGGIDAINPLDIEAIDILKDASSTAIYGSRGANGVILVTTKRGKSGKMTLNYNGTMTVSNLYDYADYMNSEQYIDYRRNAYREAGKYPAGTDYDKDFEIFNGSGDPIAWENIAKGWEGGAWNGSKVPNTDWAGYVSRTGITSEHTISASGGTDKMKAYGSFGYLNDAGTNKGQDYERYSSKIGVEVEPTKWFKMGANISSTWSIQNYGYTGSGSRAATAIYGAAMGMYPYAEPYDADGNWIYLPGGFTNVVNPIEEYKNVTDERKTLRALGSFYAEVKLFDGLKYRINFGPDFRQYRQGVFRTAASILQGTGNGVNYASANASQDFSYTLDNLLYYDKTFGEHTIGATLLQTASDSRYENYTMTAENLEWDEQRWYAFGLNDLKSKGSSYKRKSLSSYMARVNYGYANKYLLTLSGRWDGASQLAEGNKWDFFPSAAIAWRLDQEAFMQNIDWVHQLKLRAGMGTTGNAAVAEYATQGAIAHTFYSFYDNYESGYYASDYMLKDPPKMANRQLGWEKSTQYNIGVDFSILSNRVGGSIDLYKSNTSDLLMNMSILSLTGYTSTYANIGKTSNRGIDISLNTRNIVSKDFVWNTDLTFSATNAKIEELANGKEDDVTNKWFIGEDLNVAYDYEKIGIWQTSDADEMAKFNANGHTYEAGDIKVRDLNDDYTIDANNDRKVIGSYNPKWTGGMTNTFTYKDFELSLFIYARWGFLMDGGAADMQGLYQSRDIDYWRTDNPTNAFPKADYNNGGQPLYYSSMNFQDGSFIKMRNINFGYNLPQHFASTLGISSAKVYVQTMNPFMIYSKCDFMDGDSRSSVDTKSWVFGLSLSF